MPKFKYAIIMIQNQQRKTESIENIVKENTVIMNTAMRILNGTLMVFASLYLVVSLAMEEEKLKRTLLMIAGILLLFSMLLSFIRWLLIKTKQGK